MITHPRPIDETPLKIIEDEESMKELVEALKVEKSIAVDLEHHDYRSYQGFTCLIQVSLSGWYDVDFDPDYRLPGGCY